MVAVRIRVRVRVKILENRVRDRNRVRVRGKVMSTYIATSLRSGLDFNSVMGEGPRTLTYYALLSAIKEHREAFSVCILLYRHVLVSPIVTSGCYGIGCYINNLLACINCSRH